MFGTYFIFALFCAILGAVLADRMHRGPYIWFIVALLVPISLVLLLALGDGRLTRPCPHCGDDALEGVQRCRHCGQPIDGVSAIN